MTPKITLFLILASFLVGIVSIRYVYDQPIADDSAIYSYMGWQLAEGKTPYRDAWEQKSPVIFFVDALMFRLFGNTIYAVRWLEIFLAGAACAIIFMICRKSGLPLHISFPAVFVFAGLMYRDGILQGGNLTEEYGAFFLISGILCCLMYEAQERIPWLALGTVFFTAAVFTKEVFALSILPWLVYLTSFNRRVRQWKLNKRTLVIMLLSGAGAILALVAYLAYKGVVLDWLEVIQFNFLYTANYKSIEATGLAKFIIKLKSIIWKIEFMSIPVIIFTGTALFKTVISRKDQVEPYLPVFIFAGIGDFISIYISPFTATTMGLGHYLMQLCPSLAILTAFGMYYMEDYLGHFKNKVVLSRVIPGIILLPVLAGFFDIATYKSEMGGYYKYYIETIVKEAEFIKHNSRPEDRIQVIWPGSVALYILTQRSATSKYFYFPPHFLADTFLSTGKEKLDCYLNAIENNPPKFIILQESASPIRHHKRLAKFIADNYQPTAFKEVFILKKQCLN